MNFLEDRHEDYLAEDCCQSVEDAFPIDQVHYLIEYINTLFLVIDEDIQRYVKSLGNFQQEKQVNEKESFLGSIYMGHHSSNPLNYDYESDSLELSEGNEEEYF